MCERETNAETNEGLMQTEVSYIDPWLINHAVPPYSVHHLGLLWQKVLNRVLLWATASRALANSSLTLSRLFDCPTVYPIRGVLAMGTRVYFIKPMHFSSSSNCVRCFWLFTKVHPVHRNLWLTTLSKINTQYNLYFKMSTCGHFPRAPLHLSPHPHHTKKRPKDNYRKNKTIITHLRKRIFPLCNNYLVLVII